MIKKETENLLHWVKNQEQTTEQLLWRISVLLYSKIQSISAYKHTMFLDNTHTHNQIVVSAVRIQNRHISRSIEIKDNCSVETMEQACE